MPTNNHILTLNGNLWRLQSFLKMRLGEEDFCEAEKVLRELCDGVFEVNCELNNASKERDAARQQSAYVSQQLFEPIVFAQRGNNNVEDVQEVDTSFFCADMFSLSICEKNIRTAIAGAKSKADACRRIMALETLGYIRLSNVKDERKAELINPFSAPKYTFKGEDFRKARGR